MIAPSTYTNRPLRVATPMSITGFWLHDSGIVITDGPVLHGTRFTVDPPAVCEPGVPYRLDLDLDTHTATITEESP